MKVTKILIVVMLSCMLFAGCKVTDIGKEAGVAMEKATYRQVSMEEAMELMETEENYIICAISVRFFTVHYRRRKNAFHGVCQPTGKVITLFILLPRRNISACIRALLL